MNNFIVLCPTCKASKEKVTNPTLVSGYERIIYQCGAIIDYFGLNSTIIKKCESNTKDCK